MAVQFKSGLTVAPGRRLPRLAPDERRTRAEPHAFDSRHKADERTHGRGIETIPLRIAVKGHCGLTSAASLLRGRRQAATIATPLWICTRSQCGF